MQATTASTPHFDLTPGLETSPNPYHGERLAQAKQPDSRETSAPSHLTKELYDVVPSHHSDASASSPSEDRTKSLPVNSASKTNTLLLPDTLEEEILLSGMNPTSTISNNTPPPTLNTFASSIKSEQKHLNNANATPLNKNNHFEDVVDLKRDHEEGTPVHLLRELAANHMATTGLRSDAQEQGKKLKRLYNQFHDEASSLMVAFKDITADGASAGSADVGDQVDALSKLLSSIEVTRETFHEAQERLSIVEWELMVQEKQISRIYGAEQSVSSSVDDSSGTPSHQPRVSSPLHFDEHHFSPKERGRFSPQRQAESQAFKKPEINFRTLAEEAHIEAVGPAYMHPSKADSSAPIYDPLNNRLADSVPHLEHADTAQLLLAAREPLMRYEKSQNLQDLDHLGAQFVNDSKSHSFTASDPVGQVEFASDTTSVANHISPRISRWLALGVPWSSPTRGHRHRPCQPPPGVSALQVMTVNHYEATALGLSILGQLDLAKYHRTASVSAKRNSLLRIWAWEPKAHSDLLSSSGVAVGEAETQTRTTESRAPTKVASEDTTPEAATMPHLGGSLGTGVLLNEGMDAVDLKDRRLSFTSATHAAQSDINVVRQNSRGKYRQRRSAVSKSAT